MKKRKLIKKTVAGFLSIAMVLTTMNFSTFVSEVKADTKYEEYTGVTDIVYPENKGEEVSYEDYLNYIILGELPSDTNLVNYDLSINGNYYGHSKQVFYGNFGLSDAANFTSYQKSIYTYLKSEIEEIAKGKKTSTIINYNFEQSSRPTYTKEELGGTIDAQKAVNKFNLENNTNKLTTTLLNDCPYELYWYDKTIGYEMVYSFSLSSDCIQITDIEFSFYVNKYFQDNNATDPQYAINNEKLVDVNTAINNAKTIVEKYKDKSDYEKLRGYLNEICNLTEYNNESGSFSNNSNPWQLIYVFDGNPNTKVVCEGYAKAFQYLCDLTAFNIPVTSYIVTGTMTGGTGAGGHMWNVVSIAGKNYIVDVTNCDGNSVGNPDLLFLAGLPGSVLNTYTFTRNELNKVTFKYSLDSINLYGTDILTLETDNYDPNAPHSHYTAKVEKKDANCSETGNNEYWKCLICGQLYKDKDGSEETTIEAETLPVNGKHDFIAQNDTNDTSKSECSICHKKNIAFSGITVEVTNPKYSGLAVSPTAIAVKSNTTTLVENEDYEISVETQINRKSEENYTLTITGKGNYAGTKIANWNIERILPTADSLEYTAPNTLVYKYNEGKSATVTAKSGVTGLGNITVYYLRSDRQQESPTVAAPIDAGTYDVYAVIEEGLNYKEVSVEDKLKVGSFTIIKADINAPNAPIIDVNSILDTKVTITIPDDGYTYEYSKDGSKWQSSNVFEGLNPYQAYSFYQRFAETDNTNASGASAANSVTTKKSIPVFSTVPSISGTYGNTLNTMTLSKIEDTSDNGVAGIWSITESGANTIYPTVGGNVAYEITFTPTSDAYETITKTVIPTVGKKSINLKINDAEKTYSELNPLFSIDQTDIGTKLVSEDTYESLGITITTTATQTSDTGSYPITASYTNMNYDITFTNGTLIINKVNSSIAFKDYAPGRAFNGTTLTNPTAEQLTLIGANISDVDFVWYLESVSEGNKISGTPVNAGDYYLVATVRESKNTGSSTVTSKKITITKAIPSSEDIAAKKPNNLSAVCKSNLLSISLPSGFQWTDSNTSITGGELESGQTITRKVKYIPSDLTNYEVVEDIELNIVVTHNMTTQVSGLDHTKHISHCSGCNQDFTPVNHILLEQINSEISGQLVSEATCTTPAVYKKYCRDCNALSSETFEYGSAKGHTEVTDKGVEATCTTEGKTDGSHCSVCKAEIKKQGTINATGHSFDAGTISTQPTTTQEGIKTFICTKCGATKTETVPKLESKPTPENKPSVEEQAKIDNADCVFLTEEDGNKYWYENGKKQGVKKNTDGSIDESYRGKEIFDPVTNAWYWLDNIDGGKIATSKDVYQESYAGDWGDIINPDGTRNGKWVRYDANGYMVKGWCQGTGADAKVITSSSAAVKGQPVYYFDLIYGTMAKGYATIDGVEYYFNPYTGVLEGTVTKGLSNYTGWKEISGVPYWYENGNRQGVSANPNYRGKEIFDPDSNAWYWLDNIDGGKKAVSKDVFQESLADDAGNIGKWVRYDAEGHMIKGWDSNDNGTYYFDLVYGTMLKGWHNIDGVDYFFNEATGVLEK